MKRIGNLYDEIASPDNVRVEILKASRGKRDRPQVRAVLDDLENKVLELSHALRTETVELHEYTADQRAEGSRNKKSRFNCPAQEQKAGYSQTALLAGSMRTLGNIQRYGCPPIPGFLLHHLRQRSRPGRPLR